MNSTFSAQQTQPWIERFPQLAKLEDTTKRLLTERSQLVDIPADSRIFGAGLAAEDMLFLLDGTVRVQQVSDTGREIVLYRAHAGESCVMTNACLFAYEGNAAEGIAETRVQAASIPRQLFDELVAQSAEFRNFVFFAFSKRITDLFQVIDEVAFQRLDVRLADKLLELADDLGEVTITHQGMSTELGTAREVVSRQLQEFQRRGWVELLRGKVVLLDRTALEQLAGKK